ncbi:hypothetical protein C8A03DRAFT_48067 [Achaetomium macrosporum]|uniref:NAD(P)-binding protein n=1 Tax=Achaetomium macrosporum TaxID=79813 RepID=A0AAN7C150_9PEZI|nr:hypothetical protein C8A03DRAFT_48067 [Achaetomium macrosporum]
MICNNKSVSFNAAKDIPPVTDKVILVTGGNVGLGKQAVLEYARQRPQLIWLAARSTEKGNAARRNRPSHLASFTSIKAAAATVLSTSTRLDILMLNAGIIAQPPGLTADGYELQFGTNHIGHALLTKLLLPLLIQTATTSHPPKNDVRVVSLSSHGHVYSPKPGINFDTLKTPAEDLGSVGRYSQSKLANVLWARQLARVYPQLTVATVHPGMVNTQLVENATGTPAFVRILVRVGRRLFSEVEDGVKNQLWASVAAEVKSGEYYEPVEVAGEESAFARDEGLRRRLWEWTEKELEGHGI